MNKLVIILLIATVGVCGGWLDGFADMQSITVFCGSANKPAME